MKNNDTAMKFDGCGDVAFQVLKLTERINNINNHLGKNNKKDYSSKLGSIKLVMMRKRLLKYLHAKTPARYFEILKVAGLRG